MAILARMNMSRERLLFLGAMNRPEAIDEARAEAQIEARSEACTEVLGKNHLNQNSSCNGGRMDSEFSLYRLHTRSWM